MVNSIYDRRSSLAPRKSIVLDTTTPEKQQIYYVYQDQKYIYNISKDAQDNNNVHPAAEQYFNSLNYKNVKDKAQAKRTQMEEIDDETLVLKRALLIKQHAAILKRNTNRQRTQEWLKEEENHKRHFISAYSSSTLPVGNHNGIHQSTIPGLKQPEWPGGNSLEVLWNKSSRHLSSSLHHRSKSSIRSRPSVSQEVQRSRHDSYPLLPSVTKLTNQLSLPIVKNPYWQLGSPTRIRNFCNTSSSPPPSRLTKRKAYSARP